MYLTNIYNTTVPLIRYELTDQLTIYDRPAACGSNFRATSWVEGRREDHFMYTPVSGKVNIHAHLFRHVLEHTPRIIEYQVKQTVNGADVTIVTNEQSTIEVEKLSQTLREDLEKAGLEDARVLAKIASKIERTSAQKLSRFIPC